LLEKAERSGDAFMVTTVVVLELIWVLSSVYGCRRGDIIDASEPAILSARFPPHDLTPGLFIPDSIRDRGDGLAFVRHAGL
jgi:hypothetical protein